MNKHVGAERKLRGAFFTPEAISEFLADWAIRCPSDQILEPSCGDAIILKSSAKRLATIGAKKGSLSRQLRGLDIDGPSVEEAKRILGESASISHGDFFDLSPTNKFDVVIGNPPFVRYQDFIGDNRAKGLRAALIQGVRLTSLASSWAAFTIHAASFLNETGRLAFVLPAELLSVNYAAAVRGFLLKRFASVRLVMFEELVFPNVLEEVVLLLAEGIGGASHFEVYEARNANSLLKIDTASWRNFSPVANEKWTSALLPGAALATYRDAIDNKKFSRLLDWGCTYLGSVTGNNNYFTISERQRIDLGFRADEVLRLSPPGSRHLHGFDFTNSAWNKLLRDDARCHLFYPRTPELSIAAQKYISVGERDEISNAYKCRVRTPWWRVPLVEKPDLFLTYMNHERPRMIANEAGVSILNSLYGISLKPGLKKAGKSFLPIASLNTLTLLGSEIVGRAYGGGMLKHEPREADLLPVPSKSLFAEANQELQLLKPQLAVALRQNDLPKATDMVDAIVLRKHMGLNDFVVDDLRQAREVLFRRRLSRGHAPVG